MSMIEVLEYDAMLFSGEKVKAIAFLKLQLDGSRWLGKAVRHGCISVVKYLLNAGARTYLEIYHDTVEYDQFETAKLLVSYGIPPNRENWCSKTALDYAFESNKLVFAHFFIENRVHCSFYWYSNIVDYQDRREQLKEMCMIILFAKNGHRDTNRMIARVMWALRAQPA